MAEEGRHGFELIHKPYTSDTLVQVFRKVLAEQAASPAQILAAGYQRLLTGNRTIVN
jgi:hypothetical protein